MATDDLHRHTDYLFVKYQVQFVRYWSLGYKQREYVGLCNMYVTTLQNLTLYKIDLLSEQYLVSLETC